MKRPQSAKIGTRGYWKQNNLDQPSQYNNSHKNFSKKQVVIMKPDLTSHDFSRILPKKIHQDKERLYSETLQLKQSINDLTQENMRLKTKISILEKQKNKMGKYLQSSQDASNKKSQSRLQLYGSRIGDKENSIIQNLKKLVRQSKQEIEYLKNENMKIKKAIKYTKINEVQIQKKIIFDQNKRISQMLQELSQHINDQKQLENENIELKKYLQEEMQQNKILSQQNQKYQEIVQELQNKIRSQVDKYQNKDKKLNRDLALQKRKNLQNQKHIEDLRRELNQLRIAQAQIQKPKRKPLSRPTSSYPNKRYNSNQTSTMKKQEANKVILQKRQAISQDELAKSQTQQIKIKNSQLQKQLNEIRSKLQKSENQLKKRGQKNKESQKQNLIKSLPENDAFQKKDESVSYYEQKKQQKQIIPQKRIIRASKEDIKIQINKPKINKQQQSYNQRFDQQQESYNYNQQFQKVDESKQSKLQDQIQKVKQDFQQNQQQQQIYKKQSNKVKNGNKKKKKDGDSNEKKGYKPNKKILSQIKQLLTYRMKAQRYPFSDLKTDIQSAQSTTFNYTDLCDMFMNEPFYLTPNYTKALLSYFYQSDTIGENDLLKSSILVSKLRKVIEDFDLMEEQQQKQMIIRISEMTCTYPQELQSSFQEIKNGQETVSKQKLIEMFERLELQKKYIELIISQLSLCSSDLEHLNFHGFFERFYIDDDPNQEYGTNPIQEQGEESQESYRDIGKKKKSLKAIKKQSQDDDEDYNMGRYMMAIDNKNNEKNNDYDDGEIVSDDGRI